MSENKVAAIGFFKDSDSKEAKAYLEVAIVIIMILSELSLIKVVTVTAAMVCCILLIAKK